MTINSKILVVLASATAIASVILSAAHAVAAEAPPPEDERGSGRIEAICYGIPDRTGCKGESKVEIVQCGDDEVYRGGVGCRPAQSKSDTYQPDDDIGSPDGTQGSGTR